MSKLIRAVPLAALVCLFMVACQRIEPRAAVPTTLQFETAEYRDAVPLDYGELVAVTPIEGEDYQAMLWFRRGDGATLGVRINVVRGSMSEKVLVIPRR